jgi:uncharacterized membrane protein YoaK (UPF0700 family)
MTGINSTYDNLLHVFLILLALLCLVVGLRCIVALRRLFEAPFELLRTLRALSFVALPVDG